MGTTFSFVEHANPAVEGSVLIPSAASAGAGAEILVKDTGGAAGTNAITVTPNSGLIDGAADYEIASDFGFVRLRSDGVSWLIMGASAGASGDDRWTDGTPVSAVDMVTTGDVVVRTTGNGHNVTVEATLGGGNVQVKAADGNAVLQSVNGNVNVIGGGEISIHAPYNVKLQAGDPAGVITEHNGAGSAQAAAIPDAAGGATIDTQARAAINALLAYFRLRGSIHT